MTREQRDRLVAESRARARLMMPEFGDPIEELRTFMLSVFDQAFLDKYGHAMIFDDDFGDSEDDDADDAGLESR